MIRARRLTYCGIMCTVVLLALLGGREASVGQEKSAAAPDAGGFHPVAPHHALMEGHERCHDDLKRAIGRQKSNDAANQAWLLAELANVSSRHSDKEDYRNWANELRAQSVAAARAAESKNWDEAKTALKQISTVCKACHEKYEKSWKD